jgi:hypothetical protein
VRSAIAAGSTKKGGWRHQVPAPFAFRGPASAGAARAFPGRDAGSRGPRAPQSRRSAIEAR